jgi:hypothetical protein
MSAARDSGIGKQRGSGVAAGAHAGSTTLVTIRACLPTWRPRVTLYCSKSSTVALNKKRPKRPTTKSQS